MKINNKIRHTTLFLLLSFSMGAHAEKPASPLQAFKSQTDYQTLSCTITAKTALIKVELKEIDNAYTPINACIKDGKLETKKTFQKALQSISKKPQSVRLLKEYYSMWLTSFDAIVPQSNDRVIDYKQRMSELEVKVNAAWNNFEVEHGL
jgi:hypothetical protein